MPGSELFGPEIHTGTWSQRSPIVKFLAPMQQLLASLNPEQRDAVETTQGPLLVLAGAGTGKTRVITVRIAYLLSQGVDPESILAMTFTNKAAAEMKDRIAKLVGKKTAEALTVGTFHSFCLRFLRDHKAELGWPQGFSICDASDQLTTIKAALRELHIPEARLKPRDVLSRISLAKNKLLTPEKLLDGPGADEEELVAKAWMRYQASLQRTRRVDFDDLLLKALVLLRDAKIRTEYQQRYRYLLVDEYQDTNGPQFEIVNALAKSHRNLCVVGDDDQSIYGWRGADIQKILGFDRTYHEAKTVRLETNYRSTEQIIGCANRLIVNNTSRHDKALRSHAGPGEPVIAVQMRDETIEAEHTVRDIIEGVKHGHYHDEFAILFRTALQARPFEVELRLKEIPYVLVGGLSFFDRKEVRDVLAYLKLLANQDDESSLMRIINCPPRGVGKTTQDRVIRYATDQGISTCEAFLKADQVDGVSMKRVAPVQRLLENMRLLRLENPDKKNNLPSLIQQVVDLVGYEEEVHRLYKTEDERTKRWQGVLEVMNYAENYVRKLKRPTLNGFLDRLTLSANDSPDAEDAKRKRAVTLMTLHASKGLEFPHVFLVGLEENLLPHTRSAKEGTIEEERRLAYVGITRAQKVLQMSWCGERARGGSKIQRHPSRFLLEVQNKKPPENWIPAGSDDPTGNKAKKKRKGARRARR
ncbi:MAG: DNA helicase-2/ATP-dependent DNA helicase PcrA [Planctomycetota bacterium]|jgi:DNA helicase-2/ATP-dependent DNA helicase PcrA